MNLGVFFFFFLEFFLINYKIQNDGKFLKLVFFNKFREIFF